MLAKIKSFLKSTLNRETLKKNWLYSFLAFSLSYGFLLAFIAYVIFGFKFGFFEILAFGFAYYFFRFELYAWIRGVFK